MAIIRIYASEDGKSHIQDIEPDFQSRPGWPKDEDAVIHTESGILMRRYDPSRFNSWHPSPGRVCVFTLTGGVEIEASDGSKRRVGPGDVVIAEDAVGEGHFTREVGDEPRLSIYVPLR